MPRSQRVRAWERINRAGRASRACRREADISFFSRILFAVYFLEAGLILIVAPWSQFWEQNFFAASLPALAPLLSNPFVRGGVSGVGVITALAGLAEIGSVFGVRRPHAGAANERLNAER